MGRTWKTRSPWVGWKVKEIWSQGTILGTQFLCVSLNCLCNIVSLCWLSWKMRATIIVIHERWVHRWETCRNHPGHSKWSPKVSHLGGKMWCGCFQTQMFVFWWLTSPALMSSKHKGCIFWTIPKWFMTLFKREWEVWLSHKKGSWLKPWKEFH